MQIFQVEKSIPTYLNFNYTVSVVDIVSSVTMFVKHWKSNEGEETT